MTTAIQAVICYWFPGSRKVPDGWLWRFRDARGNERFTAGGADSKGPVEDKRGLIISPCQADICQYLPQVQRWDEVGPGAWIGVHLQTDPAALLRTDNHGGRMVAMGDGRQWLLPVVNPLAARCSLPVWERLLPGGKWKREVQDRYRALADDAADFAQDVMQQVIADGKGAFAADDDRMRDLIGRALALNYDLTLQEMSALRLFAPDCYWPALQVIVDWDECMRIVARQMEAANAASPFGPSRATGDT